MNLHDLFRNVSDGERLFQELVSPEWCTQASLKRLQRKFLNPRRPFLLIRHFLKLFIAEFWYEELQSSPHRVQLDYFKMRKWPTPWKAHYQGKIEGHWDLVQEKHFIVGQLVQALFLSDYFSRFLSGIVGTSHSLTYLGGHHQQMGAGDWINPHDDALGTREITAVYYAAKEWKKAYGGYLFIGPWEAPRFHIAPRFNQLLVLRLERHMFHGVEPIRKNAGDRIRYSSIFWFCEKNHRVKI